MSQGGRHGHTLRRLRRRMDAVLEDEQARRGPIPPPISLEHAALRDRIERGWASLCDPEDPENTDLDERITENPELLDIAADLVGLMREERELLASHGVDYRPYDRYQPKFDDEVRE